MPTVPKLERNVATQAISTRGLSTSVPVGNTAGSQKAAFDLLLDAKNKADKLVVDQAFNASSQASNDFLHGENGAITARGVDAIARGAEVQAEWSAHVDTVATGFQNEEQRAAYRTKAGALGRVMDSQIQKHTSAEAFRQNFSDLSDSAESFEASAGSAFNDLDASESYIVAIKASNTDIEALTGTSRKSEIATSVSNARKDVVSRLIASDQHDVANAYFEEHRGDIQHSAALIQKLNVSGVEATASQAVIDILKQPSVLDESGRFIMSDVNKQIDSSTHSQKTKDNMRARAKNRNLLNNAEVKRVEDGHESTLVGLQADDDVPLDALKLTVAWQNATSAAQKRAIAFDRSKNIERPEQLNEYAILRSDPSFLALMSPEEVGTLRSRVGKRLAKTLIDLKATMAKSAQGVENVELNDELFKSVAVSLGFEPFKKKANQSQAERRELVNLQVRVEEALLNAQIKAGRDLSDSEKVDVMRKEAETTVAVKGGFFRDLFFDPLRKPAIAVTASDKVLGQDNTQTPEVAALSDLKQIDVDGATAELNKRKIPVTDSNIRKLIEARDALGRR